MLTGDGQGRELGLPNTLKLNDDHTARMVGHFLRRLYSDILAEDCPRRFRVLIEKLDAAEHAEARSRHS